MEATHNTISVVMLPWLAHGHISPFLELAKKLTTRNFHIYFCTTPINLGPIKQKLSEKDSLSIELVELHLPSLLELRPQYHTTNGLPPHLMPTLKKAMDMASLNITTILKQLKPDFFIYDFLQILAPSLAQSQNIPTVDFLALSASMASFFMHLANNPGVEYPSPELYLQDYEVQIEAKYVDYLSVLAKKKIVLVGPLVQDPVEEDEKKEIIGWLNGKEPSSSVFVSFGSEYLLSKEEMQEIAYGLELSMVNFILVVRFPRGEKVNPQMALPKGFLDSIGDRGMVVEGWAPQKTILKHSSIGGFVSHCGWSYVMESMKFGAPIIAMPMHLDQPVNARLVEELGAGVEVKRDTNGRLEREEVAKVIRKIDGVVQDLLRLCSKKKQAWTFWRIR
ncbi:hypothetical protein ACB094_11G178700 [Castanea mollissima]